jgi:hypothetical protein
MQQPPGSSKVFAIMESAGGCFMIAKTFAPFPGVKPFAIMREPLTVHDRGTCEGTGMSEQPEFFTHTRHQFLGLVRPSR